MSEDKYNKNIYLKKIPPDDDTSSGEGEAGSGGQSGQIEFRDFLAHENLRDDLLSADEKKRLLSIHQDTHEARVKKQKELRDQRQVLKAGKISLQTFRQGLAGSDGASVYKTHPYLVTKAQFSGIDRQVIALPTENVANTNDALRNELELQYRLRHAPDFTPRFNPKPQYR